MKIIDVFTEEMIEHLKKHPELLKQRQGKDIMQNFLVTNPEERHVSFREAMENLRKKKQKIFDDPDTTAVTHKIVSDDIDIIDNFVGYMGISNSQKSRQLKHKGLDIPKMRKYAVKYSEFLLRALAVLIEDYKKDIAKYPELQKKLQVKIDAIHHVLLDFSILLKIKFPTSTPYLRELKKKFIDSIF